MLHSFYRDEFLRLSSSSSSSDGGSSDSAQPSTAPDDLRRQLLARQAACMDGRQCVDQLSEAFAISSSLGCRGCCLDALGDGLSESESRRGLTQFSEWRAAQLRKSAMTEQSVLRCWAPVLTVPIDWAAVRCRRRCLCPFLVPNGGGLVWRPACPEAACLLLAQACGIGVDLHLRLRPTSSTFTAGGTTEEAAVTPCHSFLMGNFVQLYRSGQWPPKKRLTREGRRLMLDLDAGRCPPEVVQFVFYSAYGHVICLRDNQRVPTPEGLASLYTVARHVISEGDSDFRRLADVSGLLTNIIVLLDRVIGRLQPAEDRHLLADLASIFQLCPRLFGDLRARLADRLRAQAMRQLAALDHTPIDCLHFHRQRQLCEDKHSDKDCLIVEVCTKLFRELILRDDQAHPRPLEACLQSYLAHLVDLHESDRCAAMLQACRDLRHSTGLLSLLMPEQPSGCPSLEHSRLCRLLTHLTHTLLQLTCDQAVLNFADAASFVTKSELKPATPETIVAADFRFVAAFTETAISALGRCGSDSSEVDDGELLRLDSVRRLRADLCGPEILAMLQFQEARASLEAARQRLVAGAKSSELSDIAYHSCSAGRLPHLRLLVQAVAVLLLGELGNDFNNNDFNESRLCSEGRRLLLDGSADGLISRLRRANSTASSGFGGVLALLSRPQLCRPLMQLMLDANDRKKEVASSTIGLLMDWARQSARCLTLLRLTSRVFASPRAVQSGLLQAGGCLYPADDDHRAVMIKRLADELLAGGELEPDKHSALAELLAAPSGGQIDAEEKLNEVDIDEEAGRFKHSAGTSKASFLMRLLPSQQSQPAGH